MNLQEHAFDDAIEATPSCICFLIKYSIFPGTWKPLTQTLSSFICFIFSIISIILFTTALLLSLETTGYPTPTSTTPGVCVSLISFISCFYSCHILYYSQPFQSSNTIFPSIKSFYFNLSVLLFLCITAFATAISGIFITPPCLWYTYSSIPWFIGTSIASIILLRDRTYYANSINIMDNNYSVNASELVPPPNNSRTNRNKDPNDRQCCLCRCCTQCCFPIILCIMALLIVIQSCFSAHNPPIQGALYSIEHNGYQYKLQALCKGTRSIQYNFTIVLSHGGGANSVSLQTLQDYLSTDYRVCVYTRPGYAWSDAAPLDAMGNMNNTVSVMMDLMENKLNEYAPYVVIGHSVGGQIAKNAAFFYPDKVYGIVLLDSVPDFKWQMIDSNGTYDDCVDVFNTRMTMLMIRYLTPFGILRAFLGSQSDMAQYKADQFWAINLDSMWNSQWAEMKWQSQHYKEIYDMENKLQEYGVLGNIPLLTIAAGLDENCTQANYAMDSQDCRDFERKQRKWFKMHIDQKNTSMNGEMIICRFPCKHDFAWTKAKWIYETITPFLQNITKSQ